MAGGFEVVFNKLPQVVAAMHDGAAVAVRKVTLDVQQGATEGCPVATGALQASGYHVFSDATDYNQATGAAESLGADRLLDQVDPPTSDLEAIVAYAAYYAAFVHWGTSRQAAQPWLQSTLESMRGTAPEDMAKIIAQAIEAAARL